MRTYLNFDNILEKLNFSWEGGGKLGSGGKLRSWMGSCPLCPIANYVPDLNPLPLSGWRSVGMWF